LVGWFMVRSGWRRRARPAFFEKTQHCSRMVARAPGEAEAGRLRRAGCWEWSADSISFAGCTTFVPGIARHGSRQTKATRRSG
jgi:hypothetical protein